MFSTFRLLYTTSSHDHPDHYRHSRCFVGCSVCVRSNEIQPAQVAVTNAHSVADSAAKRLSGKDSAIDASTANYADAARYTHSDSSKGDVYDRSAGSAENGRCTAADSAKTNSGTGIDSAQNCNDAGEADAHTGAASRR